MTRFRPSLLLVSGLLLSACAVSVPAPDVTVTAPASWMTAAPTGQSTATAHAGTSGTVDPAQQAALPHAGNPAQLRAWWQQWNDPVLLHLLDSAQQASPGVAAAATRVAQARHAVVSAGAAGSPAVNASTATCQAATTWWSRAWPWCWPAPRCWSTLSPMWSRWPSTRE